MTDRIAEMRAVVNTEGIDSSVRHLYERGIKVTCKIALAVIEDLQREVAELNKVYEGALDTLFSNEEENKKLKEKLTWQPIETAPKDETIRILAFFPREEPKQILTVTWGYHGWQLSPDGGTEFSYEIEGNPTHWMPLPEKPDQLNN